ncbi:hypothetical protein DFAR_2310018 [Desulfarculales bacterium]
MEGHPTVPHGNDLQGILEKVVPLRPMVEEYLSQAGSHEQARQSPEHEPLHLLRPVEGAGALEPPAHHHVGDTETDEVHQAIPAHSQRPQTQGHRVEIGELKHQTPPRSAVDEAFLPESKIWLRPAFAEASIPPQSRLTLYSLGAVNAQPKAAKTPPPGLPIRSALGPRVGWFRGLFRPDLDPA